MGQNPNHTPIPIQPQKSVMGDLDSTGFGICVKDILFSPTGTSKSSDPADSRRQLSFSWLCLRFVESPHFQNCRLSCWYRLKTHKQVARSKKGVQTETYLGWEPSV